MKQVSALMSHCSTMFGDYPSRVRTYVVSFESSFHSHSHPHPPLHPNFPFPSLLDARDFGRHRLHAADGDKVKEMNFATKNNEKKTKTKQRKEKKSKER